MVGRRTLNPSTLVRIQLPQPKFGGVVERFIALVLKTRDRNWSAGSNPAASAKFGRLPERLIGTVC